MMNNAATVKRNAFCSALAGACMFFGVTSALAAPPATVPDTYATVAIGDFPGMLDRVGTLANKVKPGLSGELIRGQLGLMLGDEGMKSLAPGSGLVVVVPAAGRPFLLLETAEGKAQAIADLLKQKGLMAETVTDKLVAAATDEASLNNAKGTMGTAAAGTLDGNDDKFLMATVDADKLIQDKGAKLQEGMKNLQQKAAESGDASSTGPAQMMSLVGNMIASVGKRTDVATIKVDISGDGIQFEKTLYPIGGVKLAEPTGPSGQEMNKLLPAPDAATMRFDSFMDTKTATEGLMPILLEAMEATGISAADKDEFNKLGTLAGEALGDGFAGWVSFEDEKQSGAYLMSVADQAKAEQYIDEGIKSMSSGAMANFYKNLGITTSATLTRNAATVDGQPAHRLSMTMEGGALESNPLIKMYNVDNAMITFIDANRMLMVLDGSKLEETVKAVKAGSAASADLKSRSDLPPGADAYIDYNLGFLGEAMAKDNPELGNVFKELSDTPILEAVYADNESIKLMMVIPDEMITKASAGFEAFAKKAQEMQQEKSEEEESPDSEMSPESEETTSTE